MPDMGRGEGYGRPAILKPEDIQAMADNDEEEEGGWAGAQDEVDYAAKLDFEDFEDDEKPHTEASWKPERETTSEPETRWQSNEGRSVSDVIFPLKNNRLFFYLMQYNNVLHLHVLSQVLGYSSKLVCYPYSLLLHQYFTAMSV